MPEIKPGSTKYKAYPLYYLSDAEDLVCLFFVFWRVGKESILLVPGEPCTVGVLH